MVILFHNEVLVRVTPGINKTEVLEERKQYTLKLYNVPKNANEILLFRQIRHANAKGVHVFRNTNGNNKSYAIVTFKNKKDMIEAKKYNITYYNTKLNWESKRFEEAGSTYRNRSFTIEPQENRWRLENKLRPTLTKEKSCTTNPSRNEDI